jgi:radical SAM protein with 4Fe4S-binding SPASM domain
MGAADFERLIQRLPDSMGTLYLWGQGEPFLAPDFLRMVRFAADRGFRTVTSTNGHFLDNTADIADSGLDILIVSLDGANQETYTAYRIGGDFQRVVDGVRSVTHEVRRRGHGPDIVIQCVVNRMNEHEREDIMRIASDTGVVRTVFKTLQAVSIAGGDDLLPGGNGLSRYRRTSDGRLEPDRTGIAKSRCLRLYHSLQIDWMGNVVPCCFDKDSEYIMGNLLEEDFPSIWNGKRYRDFRRLLNERGRVLPMCGDCSEGLRRMNIHA